MDLSFNFTFPTTGKNESVKLYGKEPESSPLHRYLFQVDICHDGWSWYGSQREGKRGGEEREALGS
jgi:hypothetical protein